MIQRTVLLTGASGLLGTWLRRTAPTDQRVVGVRHRTALVGIDEVSIDLRDPAAANAALTSVRPSVVIHAAYSKDRRSIVDATRHIAEASRNVGAHLVFISSDAVFSGDGRPRSENSPPDPIWDYGYWKAEAENRVLSTAPSTIIRLPLVVSVEPADHVVHRIKSASEAGQQTTWFADELRQPALASDITQACWRIATLSSEEQNGVWHLPGPETLSRFDIAGRVVSSLGLDPSTILGTDTPPMAQRPKHLLLTDSRAQTTIAWKPSPVLLGT